MDFSFIIGWYEKHSLAVNQSLIALLLGLPLLRFFCHWLSKNLGKRLSAQSAMLLTKGINYTGTVLVVMFVLWEFGLNPATLLGAAGIAGVAIGFASQTSLSNLISGIFLIWERPFQIGDVIEVDAHFGFVHSIDLLSVTLRTFDNKLVRIPNEILIKSTFINRTRFPIRKLDLKIGVSYDSDPAKVVRVLKEIASKNPYSLDEPEPLIIFSGFGDSSLDFVFGVWFANPDELKLRNSILQEVKERFDKEGIGFPFPSRSLYPGSPSAPFPVQIVEGKPQAN